MPKFPKSLILYLSNSILFALLVLILQIPFFAEFNFLVIDKFQNRIAARSEIVIVSIDDQSLKELGSLPWNHNILAKGLESAINQKPAVIGLDLSLLEPRDEDTEFVKTLQNTDVPIVLGNKMNNFEIKPSFLENSKISKGFTNITPDQDSKVRQGQLLNKVKGVCQPSFSVEILRQYFRSPSALNCDGENRLGGNIEFDSKINFSYAFEGFTTISFSDIYNQKGDKNILKDKIVLLGVTDSEVDIGAGNNIIGIDGRNLSGLEVNTNILNSLLQNKFQENILSNWYLFGLFIFSNILLYFYQKLKHVKWEFLLIIFTLLFVNTIGVVLFRYSYNPPFVETNTILILSFIVLILYKYLVGSTQNRFLQKAFSQYINKHLLHKLLQNQEPLKLGGEKKEMTVLFSDIRGFTTLSESKSPEELVKIINLYLEKMCNVILQNNGTIDKFIGDAIMAFWNAPLDDENHHYNAILTSLQMQEALNEFNKEHNLDIKIGIGINSGDMVIGNVGSQFRFDYTVLGDNVNLGSRIEGLTKQYGVVTLVAESTVKHFNQIDQNRIIFRLVDEVTVKGKNVPIKIYEPLLNSKENQKLKTKYELAFSAYQGGDITKAKILFSEIKNDPASQVILERLDIVDLKNWSGIWKWTEK